MTGGVLKSIELFTGAGGLALATHNAGFRHSGLIEWNADACETLRRNAEAESHLGIADWTILETDVRDVAFQRFGDVDLIAGGPPCQPFSIGGKHRGAADSRNMIPEFVRAVRELEPKAFIFENVKGLTRQAFRGYFEYTTLQLTYPALTRKVGEDYEEHLSRLEDAHTRGGRRGLTYNVVSRVFNAADFGVPQVRERVFIVGFRADLGLEWHFPAPSHSLDALLYSQWVSGEYWKRHSLKSPERPPERYESRVRELSHRPRPMETPWRTIRDAISDLPEPPLRENGSGPLNHVFQPGARQYKGHTGSLADFPSKTLKAGDHGVPGGENTVCFPDGTIRYLTVREAARVQTFPDGWRFCGAWSETMRQLGNAVPVLLAEAAARSVAARLGGAHTNVVV
jgi:DNA (cytosine-5)-methyltransferase 1